MATNLVVRPRRNENIERVIKRFNKKVKKLGIPIKCQGAFDTPPAELCKLDTSRLGDMAKKLAVEEGKRKINKEIDRALKKRLGDKKEPIKSLLNKFLK